MCGSVIPFCWRIWRGTKRETQPGRNRRKMTPGLYEYYKTVAFHYVYRSNRVLSFVCSVLVSFLIPSSSFSSCSLFSFLVLFSSLLCGASCSKNRPLTERADGALLVSTKCNRYRRLMIGKHEAHRRTFLLLFTFRRTLRSDWNVTTFARCTGRFLFFQVYIHGAATIWRWRR